MSEAQLQEILVEGDEQTCLEFFAGLTEKRRRAFAPQCQKWFRKVTRNSFIETEPGTFSRNPLVPTAAIATFATASFSELKKLGWEARPAGYQTLQIILDRRPPWINEWALELLQEDNYWTHWAMIRRLMAEGLIDRPDHPNYILAMIGGVVGAGGWHSSEKTVEQALREDPSLLEDELWQLFKYEGAGENSLANWDRFTRGGKWKDAFVALVKSGDLPREQMLRSSLDALELDFNHYRAKWFATLHDALEPTIEEQHDFALRYLRLLDVSAPNIVSWAFKKVETVNKANPFEVDALISGLRPVLESRQKGIVKKTLKLLSKAAKQSPDSAKDVANAALIALAHEEADVQAAALDVVEQWAELKDEEFAARLTDYADVVAPSERKRLAQLLNATGAPSASSLSSEPTVEVTPFDPSQLDGIDAKLRDLFGIDALLDNLEQGRLGIPAVTFDGTDIPRLPSQQKISPIEELDELIEVCSRVIEDDSLVDDVERVIDGVSRLCDQKPDDFQQRVGPLLKRVTDGLKKNMAPFMGIGADDDVCGLVYAWCTGIVLEGHEASNGSHTTMQFEVEGEEQGFFSENLKKSIGFLSRRVLVVARDVAIGKPAQLLSTPTHSGGWIDPFEFVRRVNLRVNSRSGDDCHVDDACLAMLRLAPEGREEALGQLIASDTECGCAIRYALGADGAQVGETAALWIAAARCRSPWSDDELVSAAYPDHGPDAGRAASYRVQCPTDSRLHQLLITSEPQLPETTDSECITVILHSQRGAGEGLGFELGGFGGKTAGSIAWTATIWPQARESFFAGAACDIADNLDWWEAQWRNKSLLEPLLDSGVPLREMGALLLALGLAAKDPGEYGLATDIAIRAIDDGRLGDDNFGSLLARLLRTGLIKPARWQKRFSDIARISPLHTFVMQRSLQRCFRGSEDALPRDYAKLLDLLKELSIDLGEDISCESCREFLTGIKGSGKAAKTARALLKLEAVEPSCMGGIVQSALNQRAIAARRISQH